MTELVLFLSTALVVFALGFQQLNVTGGHYYLAILTSFVIGAAQIYLWRTLPGASISEVIATLLGGPVGIVGAMWSHPRLAKILNRKRK